MIQSTKEKSSRKAREDNKMNEKEINLDTRQMREVLGDIPLNSVEVLGWAAETLHEQYNN